LNKSSNCDIINDINMAKSELETATRNFEYADSEELVDIYTLQIAVARKKCNRLIRLAKEQGIEIESINL